MLPGSLVCLLEKWVPQRWNLSKRLVGDSRNLIFDWLTDQRFLRRILERVRIRSQGPFPRAALQQQVTQLDVDKKGSVIHLCGLLKRLFRGGIVRLIRIKFRA
jgi:hypothetical protein